MEKEGKVAIVTGSTGGIGSEICRELENNNYIVFRASQSLGCDVRVRTSVDMFVQRVLDQVDCIDVLVNCSGVLYKSSLLEDCDSDFDNLFTINFMGYRYLVQAVIPTMRKRKNGYIINISSMAAKRVMPGRSSYSISKFAVNALTEAIIKEELSNGIRATAICPGDTATDMGYKIASPLAALLRPSDISHTVMWLLSLSKNAVVPEVCMERIGRMVL